MQNSSADRKQTPRALYNQVVLESLNNDEIELFQIRRDRAKKSTYFSLIYYLVLYKIFKSGLLMVFHRRSIFN